MQKGCLTDVGIAKIPTVFQNLCSLQSHIQTKRKLQTERPWSNVWLSMCIWLFQTETYLKHILHDKAHLSCNFQCTCSIFKGKPHIKLFYLITQVITRSINLRKDMRKCIIRYLLQVNLCIWTVHPSGLLDLQPWLPDERWDYINTQANSLLAIPNSTGLKKLITEETSSFL